MWCFGSSKAKLPTWGIAGRRGHGIVQTRDAIFKKITNQNQTDTNEMATTETKYQTDFYFAQKYQYLTKF